MPLCKIELAAQTERLAPRETLHTLDVFHLKVQKLIREKLMSQMVGTLYPGIVADEIVFIDILLQTNDTFHAEQATKNG